MCAMLTVCAQSVELRFLSAVTLLEVCGSQVLLASSAGTVTSALSGVGQGGMTAQTGAVCVWKPLGSGEQVCHTLPGQVTQMASSTVTRFHVAFLLKPFFLR